MSAVDAARPPSLAGLTYVGPIGSGGYADVFLYTEAFPSRHVAVKVLREAADVEAMEQFRAEVNVMAQLASHPAIVSVYRAETAHDGRACLVMEYCPPPHPGDRFRKEQMPLRETLEIAVKIASAVETAHRAGILHRDIKPHNILSGPFGPMLTDFGIASATGDVARAGLSVPWSPPESFAEPGEPDVRSDVFSLAATVYSLLAGRSPFEVPGAANDMPTLMDRIERHAPSQILRSDVPERLQALLRRGMSHSIDGRPDSAMAFAQEVQEIQVQLDLPITQLEVMDASPHATAPVVSDSRTEVRPISIIIPDEIAERGTLLRPRSIPQVDPRTDVHPLRSRSAAPDTRRARRVSPPPPERSETPSPQPAVAGPVVVAEMSAPRPIAVAATRSRRWPWATAVIVVLVVAVSWTALRSPGPIDEAPTMVGEEPAAEAIIGGMTAPTSLRARRIDRGVRLTWSHEGAEGGDTYLVSSGPSLASLPEPSRTTSPVEVVRVAPGDQICVSVSVVRAGAASAPLEDCVVAP